MLVSEYPHLPVRPIGKLLITAVILADDENSSHRLTIGMKVRGSWATGFHCGKGKTYSRDVNVLRHA